MAEAVKVKLKDVYPIPEKIKKMAYISGRAAYDKLWKRSIKEPEKFWSEIASEYVEWFKKWDKVIDYNFDIKKAKAEFKISDFTVVYAGRLGKEKNNEKPQTPHRQGGAD